jgi:hypothetical protein
MAASAVAAPVVLGAPLIMRLYRPGFQQGWLDLVLLAATAVISCVNAVMGIAIINGGSVWVGFSFSGMWAVVFFTTCYCLIPTNLALGLGCIDARLPYHPYSVAGGVPSPSAVAFPAWSQCDGTIDDFTALAVLPKLPPLAYRIPHWVPEDLVRRPVVCHSDQYEAAA